MQLAPLQLTDYFVHSIDVEASSVFDSAKDPDLEIEALEVEQRTFPVGEDEERRFAVDMTIRQKFVEGKNIPYRYEVHLLGFVVVHPDFPEQKMRRAVEVNGPSMLFSAAREILRTATGRGPYGPVLIPSTTFYKPEEDVKRPDETARAGKTARKKVKRVVEKGISKTQTGVPNMNHFLAYWTFENATYTDEQHGGLLQHAASNQFSRVREGDTVWIVTSKEGAFHLLGPIVVNEIVSTEEVESRFGRDDFYPADHHILAAEDAEVRMKWIDVTEVLPELRFSGTKNDRLPEPWGPQNLQTMRKLSEGSSRMLGRIYEWESCP